MSLFEVVANHLLRPRIALLEPGPEALMEIGASFLRHRAICDVADERVVEAEAVL